jgi:hypothetical protein
MDLASSNDDDVKDVMSGYNLFGTVKEVGVDDTGLKEFYHDHFTYPLFKDDGLVFYNDFFGKRKIKLTTYNPMKLWKGYKDMNKRLKEKDLGGNMAGEGMVSWYALIGILSIKLMVGVVFFLNLICCPVVIGAGRSCDL